MRKSFSIAGAVAGILYAAFGMWAAYRHGTESAGVARIIMEFLVFTVFTGPLGAAIGLGIGLLVDGLRKSK